MRGWIKVLLAVDRALGTGEPPTRVEVAVPRHPVRAGVVCGGVLGVGIVWALSGFGDPDVWLQAALTGVGVGFLVWGVCRLARWQHAYDEKTGRAEEARQVAARNRVEPLSPAVAVLLSLGGWVVASGVFWVIGPRMDIPRSLPWAATYGTLLTTASVAGAWLQRRRLRGFEVGDRSVANRDLTFRYERAFQLWSYGASHRQLVLRAGAGGGSEGAVEIEFLDVLGMKVKSRYRELLISPAPDNDPLDEFVDVPEKCRADYVKLLVTDGSGDGFVICRALRVHEK